MNVLLVTHRFFEHSIGGTEALTDALSTSLADRGHAVWWLATNPTLQTDSREVRCRRGVVRWEVSNGFANSYPLTWYQDECCQARKVQQLLHRTADPIEAVHILHFARIGLEFLRLPELAQASVTATLTDYSVICPDSQLYDRTTETICSVSAHPSRCINCLGLADDHDPIRCVRERNLRWLNTGVTGIFTMTPHQRMILECAGVERRQFVSDRPAYPLPADWGPVRRRRRMKSRFRFGCLGRISPEKGLHVPLARFGDLHREIGCTLEIRGPDDDIAYKRRLEDLIPESGVTFEPPVNLKRLLDVLGHLDCLLLPSLWLENHPLMLTYALALGIPVLCSRLPSLEHLSAEERLYFAHPNDPDDWFNQMRAIANTCLEWRTHRDSFALYRRRYESYVDLHEAAYACPKSEAMAG
jgi:glycosyltransferase involved in cell wall biosynthesis